MERAIAEMEKIRRAEEIYSKRKNFDEEKKSSKSIYKTLFEVLFFVNIVIIIIAIQNQKYIFTEEFINKVNSYNINVKSKIEKIFSTKIQTKSNESIKSNIENKEKVEKDNNEENPSISGEVNSVTSALVENKEILTQEELDINEIKNNYSLILPVSGIKTSGFGERESSNKNVSKNHTGVDIAASQGTIIKSATSGKVIQVSSEGDYGKHIKIQIEELTLLYAHCSKIYVTEGQEINQSDAIGEVGSTGNSTGPHLHFEIKIHDRLVDPEKVVEVLEF